MSRSERVSETTPDVYKKITASRIQKVDSSQHSNSFVAQFMFLQRTVGNQAVERMIRSGTPQAKLSIEQPGDEYENFSQARLHSNTKAAETTHDVNDRAFTIGHDVVQQQNAGLLLAQRQKDDEIPDPYDLFEDKKEPDVPLDLDENYITCGIDLGGSFKCCLDIGKGEPLCLSGDSIEDARKKLKRKGGGTRPIKPPKSCPGRETPWGMCCPEGKKWDGTTCAALPLPWLPPLPPPEYNDAPMPGGDSAVV